MASLASIASRLACLRRHEDTSVGIRTSGRVARGKASSPLRWTRCDAQSVEGVGTLRTNTKATSRDVTTLAASTTSPSPTHERGVILEAATCEIVSNEGGKYSLRGEMVLDADADSLYAMLTDYNASPRIFSTVDSVETSEQGTNKYLVNQSCRWKFLVFGGAFPCSLNVSEIPQNKYMEVHLAKKGFIREFEGSWTVIPEASGGTRVKHTLALRPALTPPYAHKIFLKQIREILQDVEDEVELWGGEGYVSETKTVSSVTEITSKVMELVE